MLRRPSTFVSNRGEALGAPPPGVKRMRRRLVGPRPLQRPREVEGSGEPERGSWSPVHATAASALSTVRQAGPSRAPRRGGRARCRDVACTRASFWSGAHRERLRGRGPRGRGPGRTGRRGAAREAQVGARRSVSAGASLLPLPERTGRAPCGAQGADRGPRGRLCAGAPAAPGAQCPRLTPGSVWKGSTRLRLEQGGWDAHLRARHGQSQGHGHGQGHGGALAPELWAKAP